MNFLILGTEVPDYNNPVLLKYNLPEDPQRPLTEDEKIIKAVMMVQTDSHVADMEKLRLYYKEKLYSLQAIYNRYLSKYGIFNIPAGGLGAWIKLNEEYSVLEILPQLAEIGIYNHADNPQLEARLPIVGIRAGFGTTNLETYEKAFKLLASNFKALD